MTHTTLPYGWEASDCAPLANTPLRTISVDSDCDTSLKARAECVTLPISDPELHSRATRVYEAIGEINELPTSCDRCDHRFTGEIQEFRATLVLSTETSDQPSIQTFCRGCYRQRFSLPESGGDQTERTANFMYANGATQSEISAALNISQPTVSRILQKTRSLNKK